jgi:hypothetical protein
MNYHIEWSGYVKLTSQRGPPPFNFFFENESKYLDVLREELSVSPSLVR